MNNNKPIVLVATFISMVIFFMVSFKYALVYAFDGEGSLTGNDTWIDVDDFDSIEEYMLYLEEHPEVARPSIDEIEANANYNITVNANLQYIVKNGTNCNLQITAIQKTYKDGNYLYVLQRIPNSSTTCGPNMQLTRCTISGNVATAQDCMTLVDFGHSQTLELLDYTINSYPRFIIACNKNSQAQHSSYWSTEVGRITYTPSGSAYLNTTPRLVDIQYANIDHSPYGNAWRVDAGLSSDKLKLVIWMKNSGGNIQYSVYNMTTLKALLDAAESNATYTLSCSSSAVINAFLGSCQQIGSDAFLPNDSFQGVELSNSLTMFINGGKNNQVPKVAYISGGIISNYVYYCTWVFNATLVGNVNNVNVLAEYANAEIESPQLIGDTLYVSIYRRNQSQANGKYSIFSIPLSAFSIPMLDE